MRERIAYVAENLDEEDGGRYTARFNVHWEERPGTAWQQGPEDVPVEEAIEWGRAHARMVIVSIGDEHWFSAGEVHPSDIEQRWPARAPVLAPRPMGTALDGSEQTVGWPATVNIGGPQGPARQEAERVAAILSASASIADIEIVPAADGRTVVTCIVSARGIDSAMDLLNALLPASTLPTTHPDGYFPWIQITDKVHRPAPPSSNLGA